MFTGIIFTNTSELAKTLGTTQATIQSILDKYAGLCSSYINWLVADVADQIYGGITLNDWKSYAQILSDFYYGLGLEKTQNIPLFIIGGNNTIPMPEVENPLPYNGREYLYSDMLYCFDYGHSCDIPGAPMIYNIVANQHPRFAVGRLPFNAEHEEQDLIEYLDKCIDLTLKGMTIRGAVMTTTESWIAASTEMMRDIHKVSLSPDNVPLNNGMIVSPDLDIVYEDFYEGYVHELCKADFLVCNLHGSYEKGNPAFIGQSKPNESGQTEMGQVAIQPSVLKEACPPIFNTVACFGGRYIDYDIDDSMLLTALHNGTMLYTGACDSAIGIPGGGCSELMMKLYNIYLNKGFPAAMALMKAKHDYYLNCHTDESDSFAMYTILEFNLFGCPILWMQAKLSQDYRPELLGQPIIEQGPATRYRDTKKISVYLQGQVNAYAADDIFSYVRGLVDNNLQYIRQKVEKEVYQRLGLGNDKLQLISKVMLDGTQTGYEFSYKQEFKTNDFDFESFYYVHTNNNGDITKILQTK